MINKALLQSLAEQELVTALKPLLNHDSWAYFEEYLRREQHKQVKVLASNDSQIELARAQGKFAAYQQFATLKTKLLK